MDPARVCANRAEDLDATTPYVRGWAEASKAAEALAEQLREASLDDFFNALRADVNVFGDGLVQLGAVRPEAVERLTRYLALGLALEMAEAVPERGSKRNAA